MDIFTTFGTCLFYKGKGFKNYSVAPPTNSLLTLVLSLHMIGFPPLTLVTLCCKCLNLGLLVLLSVNRILVLT